MTTKEIKNWEWIKSVEVQYMGFLTQYLGTATDSKGFVELMKQLDKAIAYLNAQPREDQENPFITQIILISKKLTTITIK